MAYALQSMLKIRMMREYRAEAELEDFTGRKIEA